MRLKNLRLNNFMCYEKLELRLDDKGLCLITGIDLDNNDANGVGKSTITDSISWILYGMTCRGLSGDEVVIDRGSGKDCFGEIEGEIGKDKILITRYRKHHKYGNAVKFSINDEDCTQMTASDTQEKLQKYIGISYEAFINSVMFSPEITKFFSTSTDKERKVLLDSILGFGEFDEALSIVRVRMKNIVNEIEVIDVKKSEIESNIGTMLSHVHDLNVKHSNFETDKKDKINNSNKEIEDRQRQLNEIKLDEIEKEIKLCSESLEKIEGKEKEAVEMTDQLYQVDSAIVGLESSLQVFEESIEELNRKVKILKTSELSNCPICNKPISKKDIDMVEEFHNKIIVEKNKEIEKIKKQKKEFSDLRIKLFEEIDTCKKEIYKRSNILRKKDYLISELHNKETDISVLKNTIKSLTEGLDDIKKSESPYLETINKMHSDIKGFEKTKKEIEKDKSVLEETKKYLDFWEKGFGSGGLKTYILDSVVPLLNDRIKYYSEILTDGNIGISISSQSSLKGGEVREKISLDIDNVKGHSIYKGNSGGEKRRIDLCLMLALHDLVKIRSGVEFNISFYDEVFAPLSSVGIQRAMTLLREESKIKDSVFVVSHDDNLKDMFDSMIKVVKRRNRSFIQ